MRDDLLLRQINSQKIHEDEYCIKLGINNTENGSLKINSYIRCNMFFTADKYDILKVICKLNNTLYNEVCNKINKIISK
jgi:hypothetical protein